MVKMIRIDYGLHLSGVYEDTNSYIDDNNRFISDMFNEFKYLGYINTNKNETDYSIKEKFDTLIRQDIWEVVKVDNNRINGAYT